MKTPYKTLIAYMKSNKISIRKLAKMMDISYTTLHSKFIEKGRFRLDEAIQIRDIIAPGISIEGLFEKEREQPADCSLPL